MIFIKNEKLEKVKLEKNNFYLAIDFDRTITSRKSCDSWDATGRALGEDFKNELKTLANKYGPIEFDYTLDFEYKRKAMEEWYNQAMDLFFKYNLNKNQLEQSINTSNLIFREGAKDFLNKMHNNNIPIIIMSAGIGNVIEGFLKNNNCYFDNMFIISNYISFDKEGNIKENEGKIIHTLNKTMKGHTNEKIDTIIKDKKYSLLFGDFVEDKKIVPEDRWNNTIFVGFLDKNVKENLNIYKENFDILLTDEDSSFNKISNNIIME